MPVKIRLASKVSKEGGVKIAVHAPAGMGKTLLTSTLKNPVVILTEKTGADCLSNENITKVYGKEATTKIGVVEAYTIEDLKRLCQS